MVTGWAALVLPTATGGKVNPAGTKAAAAPAEGEIFRINPSEH